MRFFILIILLFSVGCNTRSVHRYSSSVDNVLALRAIPDIRVNVGEFEEIPHNKFEISCRAFSPITTPDQESYASYIKKALSDELKMAGVYSEDSPLVLRGQINKLDFSSDQGFWEIHLLLMSSNNKGALYKEKYLYQTGFDGNVACRQTAQTFAPAVQNLINKIVTSQEFKSLIDKNNGLEKEE